MINRFNLTLAAALAVIGCGTKTIVNNSNYKALHMEYVDSSVNPADDFYMFVNGKWMKKAVIPSDRGRWGAFEQLGKMADSMSLAVLEEALSGRNSSAQTDEGKAVTLFSCVLDTNNRNKQGTAPLKPYLEEIDHIQSNKDLNQYFTAQAIYGTNPLFSLSVDADAKNSNKNVIYLSPSGLGLPDREYYLKTDKKSVEIQEAYRDLVADMLVEFGTEKDKSKETAAIIYGVEKSLATAMLTKEQKRNPVLLYNPKSLKETALMTRNVDLSNMLDALGLKTDSLVVTEPVYLKTMNDMVTGENIDKLKLLLKWSVIRNAANALDDKTEKRFFGFYGTTLRGVPAQKSRRERALDVVNRSVGEALGQLYVKKYFSEDAKNKAREMVNDLIAAYRIRIKQLSWMSEATQNKALKKLDKLMIKIGYPDKWRDYSKLTIKSYSNGGSYLENAMNVRKFEVERNAAKFGKPVDKSEWLMNPQTVNAYYNPLFNEIVFPAAILQAPFFDFRNDAAVNFGGIGAVIGHEISHGFDDEGAKYDENGNLVDWWTENDLKQFKERGALLAKQFNGFEALPGKFVNGEFTMGENIGDLGGIASAYDGLHLYLKRHTDEDKATDNLSPDQRFFFSWATIWRNKIRDKDLTMRLATDPHAPGYFRAIGPLQNHEGFYKAFNVKPGNKMYRPENLRVKIW